MRALEGSPTSSSAASDAPCPAPSSRATESACALSAVSLNAMPIRRQPARRSPFAVQHTPSAHERVADAMMVEALHRALTTLTDRERRVLELRFGLSGDRPQTREELARAFNVTRERVRQVENQSLLKLRRWEEAQALHASPARLGTFPGRRQRPPVRRSDVRVRRHPQRAGTR